jgi:ankyrin repeat protein
LFVVDVSSQSDAWPAGDPPLVLAAKTGHEISLLRELLERRCPVDASSATGETALHCVAALWEHNSVAEAVRMLLQAGSHPGLADNLRRQLPLHLMAKRCGAGGKRTSGAG